MVWQCLEHWCDSFVSGVNPFAKVSVSFNYRILFVVFDVNFMLAAYSLPMCRFMMTCQIKIGKFIDNCWVYITGHLLQFFVVSKYCNLKSEEGTIFVLKLHWAVTLIMIVGILIVYVGLRFFLVRNCFHAKICTSCHC